MAFWQTMLTTVVGALSATVGVVAGAVLTRRAQDRHWVRDKQLAAYQELLRQYATFAMILRRAHIDRRDWDYDWAVWSAALTSASLVASREVAVEIDRFAQAVGGFLRLAAVDTTTAALSPEEFDQAMRAPGRAQLALVNAIRHAISGHRTDLSVWLGGSLATQPGHGPPQE